MITLLVHSKEPFLVKGLEAILRQVGGFQVLPACNTLAEVKAEILRSNPDVVLLEPGADVTFARLTELKQAANSRIVLWVNTLSAELALQAISMGIRGILRKSLSPKLQVTCLQKVHAGELWFEKALIDNFTGLGHLPLTRREGQILKLLSQGLKNREIAGQLTVTEGTIKVYLSRLFQKVGARDRFELALFALKNSRAGQPVQDAPEGGDAATEITNHACAIT